MAEPNGAIRYRAREVISHAIRVTATAFYKTGLWLFGVQGWWDGGTDG